jgi:hypothetical protein
MENHDELHKLPFPFYMIVICNLLPQKRQQIVVHSLHVGPSGTLDTIFIDNHPLDVWLLFCDDFYWFLQIYIFLFYVILDFAFHLGHFTSKTNNNFKLKEVL